MMLVRLVLAALVLLGGAACGSRPDDGADTAVEPSTGADEPASDPVPATVPAADRMVTGVGLVLDSGRPELCLGAVAESYPPQCQGVPLKGWSWRGLSGYDTAGATRFGSYAVTGRFDGTTLTVTRPPVLAALYDAEADPDTRDPFVTRCPEPAGGWAVRDPGSTTAASLARTFEVAAGLDGFAGSWVDQRSTPEVTVDPDTAIGDPGAADDPTRTIVNVAVTGDVAAAERRLREVWGGALCVSRSERSQAELTAVAEALGSLPGLLTASVELDRVVAQVVYDDGSFQEYVDARHGRGLVRVVSALRPAPAGAP